MKNLFCGWSREVRELTASSMLLFVSLRRFSTAACSACTAAAAALSLGSVAIGR